jgi:dihydroflavonol-4-reductase
MSSQILITGATGFIGRQLTRDLVKQGANVRVLARCPKKAHGLFGDDVEIVPGDVCDDSAVDAACRDIETIYHIAGTYRFGLRHRRELWRTNVEGAENLFRSAAARKVEKVVHLSSGGLLRQPADSSERLIEEGDFPARPPRFCAYKASKWHSEQRALAWAERGLPVVITSTTCPIGRGDESPTPTGRIIRDFIQRRFPFYCRTGLNFIGIGDLSRGLQSAAESGRPGERYLLTDENLWLKDFLDLLAQETGIPAPRMRLPDGLIFVIGCGGDAVDLLNPYSTGARVCIETALQARHTQFFNNARTCADLGWKPLSSIQENIGAAVAWFRSETEVELADTASSLGSHVR